jgi:hypothetical protein
MVACLVTGPERNPGASATTDDILRLVEGESRLGVDELGRCGVREGSGVAGGAFYMVVPPFCWLGPAL